MAQWVPLGRQGRFETCQVRSETFGDKDLVQATFSGNHAANHARLLQFRHCDLSGIAPPHPSNRKNLRARCARNRRFLHSVA
jgi:hypothetical protein